MHDQTHGELHFSLRVFKATHGFIFFKLLTFFFDWVLVRVLVPFFEPC